MKKIILILIILLSQLSYSFSLKGSVEKEHIPKGFFGSWAVVSKLNSTNNTSLFKPLSKDIWTLSGHGKILILENFVSGARAEIAIKERCKNGSCLKFKRSKEVFDNGIKIVFKESVSFVLNGQNFTGNDVYIVEKYKNGKIIEKNKADYSIGGVKIPNSEKND